jgi:hypothetical protein
VKSDYSNEFRSGALGSVDYFLAIYLVSVGSFQHILVFHADAEKFQQQSGCPQSYFQGTCVSV